MKGDVVSGSGSGLAMVHSYIPRTDLFSASDSPADGRIMNS